MLRFIELQTGRAHENVEHSQHRETLYIGIEALLQLENKQLIMQNYFRDSTQAHVIVIYL